MADELCPGEGIRFQADNRARYWMDFSSWEGLPSDRIFEVVKAGPHPGWFYLVASGYGRKGDYGGSIYIKQDEITRWQMPAHPKPRSP